MDGRNFYEYIEEFKVDGESEERFASRCGVAKATLGKWKKGTARVTDESAEKVLFALGFSPHEVKQHIRALLGAPDPLAPADIMRDLVRDSLLDVLAGYDPQQTDPFTFRAMALSDEIADAVLSRLDQMEGAVSFSITDHGEFSTVPCREFRLSNNGESLAEDADTTTLYAFRADWLGGWKRR
jgi:hypothetical protein